MTRVAVPSAGRLRDVAVSLLAQAGLATPGLHRGARVSLEGVEVTEMRPRDAAAWLRSERLGAAFLSTDLVIEQELSEFRY